MYDAENVEFKFSRLRRHLNVSHLLHRLEAVTSNLRNSETDARDLNVFSKFRLASAHNVAIELTSSKAIAEKGLSLFSWCIASLYVYHFSTVVDFSS